MIEGVAERVGRRGAQRPAVSDLLAPAQERGEGGPEFGGVASLAAEHPKTLVLGLLGLAVGVGTGRKSLHPHCCGGAPGRVVGQQQPHFPITF